MQIFRSSGSHQYLVTIASGEEYFTRWEKNILPSWLYYAERYDIGIACITESLIDQKNPLWKKATWQKLLLPKTLLDNGILFACYIDSDIIVNPFAPNIFDFLVVEKVGVTSTENGMPYGSAEVRRRLAYLRHSVDSNYPLDSSLHMTTKQVYEYHGFPDHQDIFCAGLLLFSAEHQISNFASWFDLYDSSVQSISGGGDEIHLNHHIFSKKLESFLPYRFQAIWSFESAWMFPNLYLSKFSNNLEIKSAIEITLLNNYFLHFAGSSFECDVIWQKNIFNLEEFISKFKEYSEFLGVELTGNPKGHIKAKL